MKLRNFCGLSASPARVRLSIEIERAVADREVRGAVEVARDEIALPLDDEADDVVDEASGDGLVAVAGGTPRLHRIEVRFWISPSLTPSAPVMHARHQEEAHILLRLLDAARGAVGKVVLEHDRASRPSKS